VCLVTTAAHLSQISLEGPEVDRQAHTRL